MLIVSGQNKTESLGQSSVDGIRVNVYLVAAAANTAITASTAFLPQNVQVKTELKRNKGGLNVLNDNLQILGIYAAKDYTYNLWSKGQVLTAAASGVYETMLITAFIPFGGTINLKGDDELILQMFAATGVFSSAINTSTSYIEFTANNSIGYEMATPQVVSQVVQTNITNQRFSLGDNVTKIMLVNLDKTDRTAANQIITSVQLNSDKLDENLNFFDLINRDANILQAPRYNPTYVTAAGAEAFAQAPRLPQTFTLFATPDGVNMNLDNCNVQLTCNGTNVNSSQNFIVATRFWFSAEKVAQTVAMVEKHQVENAQKAIS